MRNLFFFTGDRGNVLVCVIPFKCSHSDVRGPQYMRRFKNPQIDGLFISLFFTKAPRTIKDNAVGYYGILSSVPCRNVLCQGCCIGNAKCILEHCLFYNLGCVVEVSFFWFRIAASADCDRFWTRWVSAVIDICVKSRHTLHINSACSQWSWCAILYRIFYKNCAL